MTGFYTTMVIAMPEYRCAVCGTPLQTVGVAAMPPDYTLRAQCAHCQKTYAFQALRVPAEVVESPTMDEVARGPLLTLADEQA